MRRIFENFVCYAPIWHIGVGNFAAKTSKPMKPTDYIIELCSEKNELTKNDHAVCRALIAGMDAEERQRLLESGCLDWHLQNLIEVGEPRHTSQKVRNKSWRKYLRQMRQRTPGKVQEARARLQRLFNHLEWSAQRELLQYFLHNGIKTDRIWALRTIDDDFGIISECRGKARKDLTDAVLQVWLDYHDAVAAKMIVRNYPLEVIERYADLLMQDYDYLHVALRLAANSDYQLDPKRLTDLEHLYALAKLGREVSDDDAESMFYLAMLTALSEENEALPRNGMSLMSLDAVRLSVWCLGRLGKSEIIMEFYEHDRDFTSVAQQEWPSEYDSAAYWDWAKYELSSFFPGLHRVKREVLEEMMRRNPALRELVEKLELQLV